MPREFEPGEIVYAHWPYPYPFTRYRYEGGWKFTNVRTGSGHAFYENPEHFRKVERNGE